VTWAYNACQRPCTGGGDVRDEEAAGSNPATPTTRPQVTRYPVTCGRWSYYSIQQASQQLAGLLSSLEEAEQILGPRGPKLSAASLHPWIWNAAVSLWDNGYRREAVQAGGQRPGPQARPVGDEHATVALDDDPPGITPGQLAGGPHRTISAPR
jgi:hypothetical protein